MYNDCPREKRRTLEASIILDEISQGIRVTHDCVVITGDLGPLTPETIKIGPIEIGRRIVVKSPIQITNSVIQGKIIFEDTIFAEAVEFRKTSFNEEANFAGSTFCQQCIFEGSHFYGNTHFSCREKNNPRIYKSAHFLGQSNFKQTIVNFASNFLIENLNIQGTKL